MLYRQIGTHILSVSAVALLLGATAFAQTQQDQNFVKTAMEIKSRRDSNRASRLKARS